MNSSPTHQPSMGDRPQPTKPLNILTISGGGLQGVSSLLILDKLLKKIGRTNDPSGVPAPRPRPCDIFGLIAGIGTGGWLALLLGRFHMDVATALSEWYNFIECITPTSRAQKIRMLVKEHIRYETTDLVTAVDGLTAFYESGEEMYMPPLELAEGGRRCKHVFVAAPKIDGERKQDGYGMFRTYNVPGRPDLPESGYDPRTYRISHAFGVTGATRYFSSPWKEGTGAGLVYWDTKFPDPHNITDLALEEVWSLYGENVPINVVINIHPGIPNPEDAKRIARRFHWGTNMSPHQRTNATASSIAATNNNDRVSSLPHHSNLDHVNEVRNTEGLAIDDAVIQRLSAHADLAEAAVAPSYFRFGPEVAAPGTVQNDTHCCRAGAENIKAYLGDVYVERKLLQAGEKLGLDFVGIST
ncbi:MAG: hypothetical protein Q9174_006108 [Haloplaca sp. 1 TL-2023]